MNKQICAADLKPNGMLQLPKAVTQALQLRGKKRTVGFIIEGQRILMTRVRLVPETRLSDEELASLARLSKHGVGKHSFRTQEAALRHLWSL